MKRATSGDSQMSRSQSATCGGKIQEPQSQSWLPSQQRHKKTSCTRTDRDIHRHQRTGAVQTLGFTIEFRLDRLAMQDATTERLGERHFGGSNPNMSSKGGADLAQTVGERMELDRNAEDQPGLHSRQFQSATSGEF